MRPASADQWNQYRPEDWAETRATVGLSRQSCWLDQPREGFTARMSVEAQRMQHSKWGRWVSGAQILCQEYKG